VRLTAPPAHTHASDASSRVREFAVSDHFRWALRSARHQFVLTNSTVVGRGVGADLQLDDESVSRRHARFQLKDSSLVLEDLASRNGTWLNGCAISEPTHLAVGDHVTLGECQFELVAHAIERSERVTQPVLTQVDIDTPHDDSQHSLATLSPRERLVFPLLASGVSQREIAAQCGVSVKTVETYRTRISHKLGLHSRAELIRFALETGVLRAPARN
jgi:DNA-binding CsgD family transcriptional regulator